MSEYRNLCVKCWGHVHEKRWALGYKTCLQCGEQQAKMVMHCVVPLHKGTYIAVTNPDVLKQLNPKRLGE